jgi:hypothetical protein
LLDKEEKDLVVNAILSTPKYVGCEENINWTAPCERELSNKEFGKNVKNVGIRYMLYRIGFPLSSPKS